MTTLTLVKAAKALDKDAASSLRDRALAAAKAQTRVTIEYAEVLWATSTSAVTIGGDAIPAWQAWGFDSWGQYLEQELEIHLNPARSYVRMYEKFFIDLDGEWDKDLLLSITKMVALCRVVKKSNANYWLKRAAKMTCCQLDEAILQSLYGLRRKGRVHAFLSRFTSRELSNVNAILEVARIDFPKAEDRSDLIIAILEEWYGIHKTKGQRAQMKAVAGGKK